MDRPFYSVNFGEKNTWDEWALMPVREGKIEFVPPDVKTEYVEMAGAESDLDLSEVLTGYPTYKNRSGSLKFRFYDNGVPVRVRYTKLKNYLHGVSMRAVVVDDPSYYYEGRFAVGKLEYAKQGNWADVEISYNVKPYKLEVTSSVEDWLWDPFNFETGVIREYEKIQVMGSQTGMDFTIIGSRRPTVPKFTVSKYQYDTHDVWEGAYIELTIGTDVYQLPYGKTTIIPQLVLMEQEYPIKLNCVGHNYGLMLAIDMRGGSL